jgi:hypothetical protein
MQQGLAEGSPLEYAPEAVTPAALLVRGKSGSLLETAAWATKQKRVTVAGRR